jgi:RHS repeat-associated protein
MGGFRKDMQTLLIGDFNGDRKTDILLSKYENGWSVYYSTGDGFFNRKGFDSFLRKDKYTFFVQDVNKDGLMDLVAYTGWGFAVYLNNGNASNLFAEEYDVYTWFPSNRYYLIPIDINNNSSTLLALKNDIITTYSFQRNDTKQKLLTGVANSLGVVNKIDYQMLSEDASYKKGPDATYPYGNFQESLCVTKSTEQYFNEKIQDSKTYNYSNAVIHKQGLGFRGFESITETDNRSRRTIRIYDPYNFGLLKSEESPISKVTNTWYVDVQSNKITNIILDNQIIEDKLNENRKSTSYKYDTYGNRIYENIDYGEKISETISTEYYNNTNESEYLLGFLTDMTKTTNCGEDTFVERVSIPEISNGLPERKIQYINGNQVTDENFKYDEKGNLTQHSIRNYDSPNNLITDYRYNNYGRLETKTDPMGFTSTYEYDHNGRLSSIKNHKQQATTYGYDPFGRNILITNPDGTRKTISYSWAAGGTNGLYRTLSITTGQPSSWIHYDALGRETRSSTIYFNGTLASTDKLYDTYGRLQKVSLPFTETSASYWNEYQYDNYDRPLSITEASGRKTSYVYDRNNVSITKDGIKSSQFFDTKGNLVGVEDSAGTITYNLRADGQPFSIVAPGRITTRFEYDGYGRQTAIVDPSAGRKTFVYDDAKNTYQETDANGKTIKYIYDAYYRTIRKEIAGDQAIEYIYNSDGLLESETGNVSRSYTYDKLLRLSTEQENGLKKTYTYYNGNIDSKTYDYGNQNIAKEDYTYYNGSLAEIKLNGKTSIWKLNSVNALGLPTSVTTGSFTRTYGYDAFGLPTSRQAGSFQNFSYNFDPVTGNLNFRKDIRTGIQEDFKYDELNRLTNYAGKETKYDAQGNISRRSDIGIFDYGVPGKPYALLDIRPSQNAIPLRDQSVTYNSFNRPVSISEGNATANFTYNGNGQRTHMTLKTNSTLLMRSYVSDCYEQDAVATNTKKSSTQKLYLGGDFYSAPAVYVKDATGSWNIYYICRDYLGSITHITNSDGSVVQELSYDAWGRLRNPSTQVAYSPGSEPELFLGRGYTGHEHLPQFGLINMNARLYDPAVGRFLSPDPYVQFPGFSQSFNRYSYALNNPLKYTDENGEFIQWIIAGLFMAAKFYHDGYKANNNQANPSRWTQIPDFTIGYSSQGNNVYGTVGWNNNYSMGMGYSFGSSSLIGGYTQNGIPHMGGFNQNTVDPAQKVEKTINRIQQENASYSAWNKMISTAIYYSIPAAKSLSIEADAEAGGAVSLTGQALLIFKGKDAGTFMLNWSGTAGGGFLGGSATLQETNYYYWGANISQLSAEDFLGWNSGELNVSVGEFLVGGGGVSWTKLNGNKGYLIGVTVEIGLGVGSPITFYGGQTATSNIAKWKW